MTFSRLVGKHTDRPGQQPQPTTPAADPVASSQFSDIRFYSTTWCGDCRRARRIFTDLSVPYTEIDIEQAGVPAMIPLEACYLGWQQSLIQLAQLVEPEIP